MNALGEPFGRCCSPDNTNIKRTLSYVKYAAQIKKGEF